ncbi:MAG: RluA family pseudouridine synthase [Phycisphaerae bacterium]
MPVAFVSIKTYDGGRDARVTAARYTGGMTQPTPQPTTIFDWLQSHFPGASKTTLRDMVANKRIVLNHVPVRSLKQTLAPGDTPEVRDIGSTIGGATGSAKVILDEKLKIVYQDTDIMVVEKPPGLLTSTHKTEPRPTTLRILEEFAHRTNQKAQVLLVHRLDRDASGLLVFARNLKAFEKLKELFSTHDLTRRYTAVVHGIFTDNEKKSGGKLEHTLAEDERGRVNIVATGSKIKGARVAKLAYEVIGSNGTYTMVSCTLETGRKHQIRVQLRAIGHAVCGDVMYGTPAARRPVDEGGGEPPFRLALHATHLAFKHPVNGKDMVFESPCPDSFRKLVTGDGTSKAPRHQGD